METIKKEKLIAIVRGIAPEKCLKVAGALYAGGFRLVEITFDQKNPDSWATTAAAIKAVSEAYSGSYTNTSRFWVSSADRSRVMLYWRGA